MKFPFGAALLFLWCLPPLFSQRPEVFFIPLSSGPLAPLAAELAVRLQEELVRNELSLIRSNEAVERPVNPASRQTLRERARRQNLAFLLIQDADSREPDTIRHDLYSTFDGRLLSTVLVKGDSGRTALLRPVLLAREIAQQLKALPPVSIIGQPPPSVPEDLPLLQPSLVTPGGTKPQVRMSVGVHPLQPHRVFGSLDILWMEEGGLVTTGWGFFGGLSSGELQGSLKTLSWSFYSAGVRGEWGWKGNSVVKLALSPGIGAGLLQLSPEGASIRQKVLPALDIRASGELLLGYRFRLGLYGEMAFIANPGYLIWVPSGGFSAGWKL